MYFARHAHLTSVPDATQLKIHHNNSIMRVVTAVYITSEFICHPVCVCVCQWENRTKWPTWLKLA